MEKEKILKKVIAKLEKMETEELKKFSMNLDQQELEDLVSKIKILKNPEKIKEIIMQFDEEHNENQEQRPRLELLNNLKKEGFFKFDKTTVEIQEMWRRLVIQEWKIPYKFES